MTAFWARSRLIVLAYVAMIVLLLVTSLFSPGFLAESNIRSVVVLAARKPSVTNGSSTPERPPSTGGRGPDASRSNAMTCSGTHTEWNPRSSAAVPSARNDSGVVPGVDDGANSPTCTGGL